MECKTLLLSGFWSVLAEFIAAPDVMSLIHSCLIRSIVLIKSSVPFFISKSFEGLHVIALIAIAKKWNLFVYCSAESARLCRYCSYTVFMYCDLDVTSCGRCNEFVAMTFVKKTLFVIITGHRRGI